MSEETIIMLLIVADDLGDPSMMVLKTLLTFHANKQVKLPFKLQFPLYKASTKMGKLSHKTHLTSSPFPEVI